MSYNEHIINSLINNAFKINTHTFYKANYSPSTAILRNNDGAYVLALELPGIELDKTIIDVEGNTLCIKGIKPFPFSADDGALFRNEITHGQFARTFSLPNDADKNNISAKYEKGYLRITIPQLPEYKSRQIAIEGIKE